MSVSVVMKGERERKTMQSRKWEALKVEQSLFQFIVFVIEYACTWL